MNDADLEMAALIERGDTVAFLARRGVCTHSSYTGPLGAAQHGLVVPVGAAGMCPDCGVGWSSPDEWLEARDEILEEWS